MTAARPSAERIAEVVADIRAGRVRHPAAVDALGTRLSAICLGRAQLPQPVVDCTAIHAAQLARKEIAPYDDHPEIVPPWPDAILAYVNTHGNVMAMQVHLCDHDGSTPGPGEWETGNVVDWERVRWVAESSVFVGGHGGNGAPIPTTGPVRVFRHAIDVTGGPSDINWLDLLSRDVDGGESQSDADQWEAVMVTLTASLGFLNASNVDIATPGRPRAVRRRIERTGVDVQTIVVRPPGKRRASTGAARSIEAIESELSPVRGHFARYGPQYGRGLLFGKHAGKFWIPGHVRGGGGEANQRDYRLAP